MACCLIRAFSDSIWGAAEISGGSSSNLSTASQQSSMTIVSTERIRELFPALQRRHNGHAVAYFDAAGGTQVPQPVAEAVNDYLLNHNANTHWEYPTSYETDAIIEN